MAKYKLPKTKELLAAGVHFGHQTRRWHPKMERYIYSAQKNIHVIDLEHTENGLKAACEFMYDVASKGGQIVFVGTKRQAREIIENEAKRCGALFVSERWLGGTVTNLPVIKKNMEKLVSHIKTREEGGFSHYTKKERLLIDREIAKLQKNVGGIVGLKSSPAALFVVDARREKTAVREANLAGIPVAALVDTNTDPSNIEYVIPGNDDALKSVAIIIKAVSDAVASGYAEFSKKSDEAEASADSKTSTDSDNAGAASVNVTSTKSPVSSKELDDVSADVSEASGSSEESKKGKKSTKKTKEEK